MDTATDAIPIGAEAATAILVLLGLYAAWCVLVSALFRLKFGYWPRDARGER
ncbi:MAG: hypothetical protein AB7H70_04625 [Rhodospirillaceae bacterium]